MRPIFTKLLFLISIAAYSQQSKKKPVIIQGKFENFADSTLYFFYQDELYRSTRDLIKVNPDGSFYHETYKIKEPIIAERISNNDNSLVYNKIALAPGFNLRITGDAKDPKKFESSIQFAGEGAYVNTAWQLATKNTESAFSSVPFQTISVAELKVKMIELQRYSSATFDSMLRHHKQPNRQKFVRLHDYDLFFANIMYLNQELSIKSYSRSARVDQIESFARMKQISPLLQDELLIVPNFRWFLFRYIDLRNLILDPTDSIPFSKLNYVNSIPQKAVRDFSLYYSFDDYIYESRSFENVIQLQEKFDSMLHFFSENEYANAIAKLFEEKLALLKKLSIGNPIPDIPLPDSLGTMYKFSDFRGKVLFIDLWASWCGPCRAENPALKKIVESYESRPDIKFLSVSIDKEASDWKKAVRDDKMHWLQLIDDNNGSLYKTLFIQSVPRYVIVNKEGKIVNFDGPWPNETEKVKALLDAELAK